MSLIKLYKVLLFALVGIASFIPMTSMVLGWRGGGGGP